MKKQESTYWGDFLIPGFEDKFDKYLNEKLQKRVDEASFFLDLLIEQGIINLDKETIKKYFKSWFEENKDFDLQIKDGDLAMEDGDLQILPDFQKEDIVGFINWFKDERNDFVTYLKSKGVEIEKDNNKYTTIIEKSKNTIVNNGNDVQNQSIYGKNKKMLNYGLIAVILALLSWLFGDNIIGRSSSKKKPELIHVLDSVQQDDSLVTKRLIDSIDLPYLENLPILDKGIYVRYDYNNLDFGGPNIDTIKICARTRLGDKLDIIKNDDVLEIDLTNEPFIEFQYKEEYYSIELFGNHYSFRILMKENINPTMKLIPYNKL